MICKNDALQTEHDTKGSAGESSATAVATDGIASVSAGVDASVGSVRADAVFPVSVTDLASFACRTGDLAFDAMAGPTAREGIKAHQKVQRAAIEASLHTGHPVESEVSLAGRFDVDGCEIVLSGRVDLLDRHRPRLSEIKTTFVPADQVPVAQQSLQWAQLSLYGYLYLTRSEAGGEEQSVELELIHVNIRAARQEVQRRSLSLEELTREAQVALGVYARWLRRVTTCRDQLRRSAGLLQFPHGAFRLGQRDMAASVYRAARDSEALLCEAPTGIGKTLSALFPAVKSLGEAGIAQVSYLTAKVAGRLSAMQALQRMHAAGLDVTAVTLRARQHSCFCVTGRCGRDDAGRCPMAKGFYDRLPDARDECLAAGILSDTALDAIAWEHQVCPFELALQLLPWVHVVIADYNYVFDPLVRLSYYAASRKDTLLLIDEAHNLVDRSRSMYSAKIIRTHCMDQAALCRRSHRQVAEALDVLSQRLMSHGRSRNDDETVSNAPCSKLSQAAADVVEAMALTFGQAPVLPESSNDLFRTLCRYVVINELYGDYHRCITSRDRSGQRRQVSIDLYCLDASLALSRQYRHFKSVIVFSATLRPCGFYRDALGLPESTRKLQLASPFDPARVDYSIVDWIDTRYRQRESSLPALVDLIYQACALKKGKYLVFFPSYAYLNKACTAFCSAHPDVDVWKQSSDMSREQQQALLACLDEAGHRIGFAILGGIFGEGIDYAGDRLIGVIVVSPGLPSLDRQTQLVADHYRQQGHDGYDFAYRFPGFTRVLQTVGRLIRTESDGGMVLLVDDRFRLTEYKALYPGHWKVGQPVDQTALLNSLKTFWTSLSYTQDRQADPPSTAMPSERKSCAQGLPS